MNRDSEASKALVLHNIAEPSVIVSADTPPPGSIPNGGTVPGAKALDIVSGCSYSAAMLLLRQWRERRGLSVRALAREAGVGFTTINRIETGRASPTLALLGRLARALHVDARDLIVKGWPERARTTTAKAAPAAKRGAKRLCVLLAGVLLGAGVVTTPSGDVLYREGRRLGTVRADGSGGVDVYSPSGERLGYGRPSPYTPGTLEFFTPDGRRGLDIRPRAPETPKRGRGR